MAIRLHGAAREVQLNRIAIDSVALDQPAKSTPILTSEARRLGNISFVQPEGFDNVTPFEGFDCACAGLTESVQTQPLAALFA